MTSLNKEPTKKTATPAKPVTAVDKESESVDSYDRAFLKSLRRTVKGQRANALNVFSGICDHHRGKFDLNRATLFIVTNSGKQLKSFALWDQGQVRSGVMVQVPYEQSAFYELLDTQCSKTFSPAACFNGSPIEEKLTIGNSSGALFLAPLYCGDTPVGLIAFNSNERRPFTESLEILQHSLIEFGAGFASPDFLNGAD